MFKGLMALLLCLSLLGQPMMVLGLNSEPTIMAVTDDNLESTNDTSLTTSPSDQTNVTPNENSNDNLNESPKDDLNDIPNDNLNENSNDDLNDIPNDDLNEIPNDTLSETPNNVQETILTDMSKLHNKIQEIEQAVARDLAAGINYAQEPLSELYLDQYGRKDSLMDLESLLTSARVMLQEGTATDEEITDMCNKLDGLYSSLRRIETYSSFPGTAGTLWKDTNGIPIQAHGGQVQWLNGKWWWYGEDKTRGYRSNGVSAYSSDDLYNWTFEGYVMRTVSTREQLDTDPYFMELYADYTPEQKDRVFLCINDSTSVVERPKVIYNERTQKYVLWFHADGPTEYSSANYAAACAGVAVSDSPTGPFRFIDRYRLNVAPEDQLRGEWYEASKGFARDMNLFVDDDGTGYIIYSSEENMTMFISKLNYEYTYLATPVEEAVHGVDFVRLFPGAQREAPAIFKYNNRYYMITSGATGWDPNQARYWVADSILGTWTNMGDPCVGDIYRTTFNSQSTCVIPYDIEKGLYIYMGDRWISSDLGNSRYIWLPIEILPSGEIAIKDYSNWTLEDLETLYAIKINIPMDDLYYRIEDLPTTLNIRVYENGLPIDKDVTVNWDTGKVLPTVKTTVTGYIDEISREVTTELLLIPDGLLYYIDSGATAGSDLYDIISSRVNLRNNDTYDKAYEPGSWGYSSILAGDGVTDPDINYKNTTSRDAFESGFWAYGDKKIEYIVPLEAGSYQLLVGFQEWWNTTRNMGISISYNMNGNPVNQVLGNVINNGTIALSYYFDLPISTEVKVSIYEYTPGPDVILSWLAINETSTETLLAARNEAIADFRAYTDKMIQRKTDYTQNDLKLLNTAIEDGIALISEAETVLKVKDALQEAKDNFYAVYANVGKLIVQPIVKYTFDEAPSGNIITDFSNRGNNGILYGNAQYVNDPDKGQVLYLDGNNGTYAELPKGLFDYKDELTIFMDVKTNLSSGDFFTFTIGKNNMLYYFFRLRGSEAYSAITKNTWSGEQKFSSTVPYGQWARVAIVLSKDTMTMYINGLKVNELNGITTTISDFGSDVISYLGRSFYSPDRYFSGYFDNIEIYDIALTAQEIGEIDTTDYSNFYKIGATATPFKLKDSKKITNVNLTWTGIDHKDIYYKVYRSIKEDKHYQLIYEGSNTTLFDYDLIPNKPYYYFIQVYNNGILLSETDIITVTTGMASKDLLVYNNNISMKQDVLSNITTISELKAGNTYYRYDYKSDADGFLQLEEYTSTDSVNWNYSQIVMDRNSHKDLASCKLEAINIRYDPIHNKNIIWAHWELRDGYGSGKALVASATPGEAFLVHDVFNPFGVEVRDMNFFIDDDENRTGYLIAASNLPGQGANATMYIFRMNDTYTAIEEIVTTLFEDQYREAPSMIKKDGYYYLFTSQAAGWYPSKGNYASATNIAGPWSELRTIGNTSNFSAQSGGVLTFKGNAGTSYAMAANRWVREEGTSRNVLLPVTFYNGYASYDYYDRILYNPWTGEMVPEMDGYLLSLGKEASASIPASGILVPSRANDGNYYTEYASSSASWPFWWQVDLGASYDLTSIQISWFMYKGSEGYYQYKVLTSEDGVNWTTILDKTDNKTYGFTAENLRGTGRYVRVVVEKAVLHNNPNNWYTPTLYEVRIFGK